MWVSSLNEAVLSPTTCSLSLNFLTSVSVPPQDISISKRQYLNLVDLGLISLHI